MEESVYEPLPLEYIIREHGERIRNLKTEVMLVIDKYGSEIAHFASGRKSVVTVPIEQRPEFEVTEGITLVHNHPDAGCKPASPSDIQLATQTYARALIIVTPEFTYIYEPTENYPWGWGSSLQIKPLMKKILDEKHLQFVDQFRPYKKFDKSRRTKHNYWLEAEFTRVISIAMYKELDEMGVIRFTAIPIFMPSAFDANGIPYIRTRMLNM